MVKKINKNVVLFLFSSFFFKVLLEISYVNVISENFGYQGYYVNFNVFNYVLSWMIFMCGFFVVKDRIQKVSDYFFVTAFLGFLTPISVLYGYDSDRSFFPVFVSLMAILFTNFISKTKLITFRNTPVFKNGLDIVVAVSVISVVFLIFWYFVSGVSFNLDLSKVYDFRDVNAEKSASGIFSYTNNWTYKIFNMTLFSLSLLYRRYFFAVLVLVVQVYFYAASAHKSVLFFPLIILSIWFYFRRTNSLVIVPVAFSLVIISTLISYYLLGDLFLSSLFSRRVFIVPANLTYVYFDFFSYNQHVYWSNSIFSSFLTYPYDLSLSHVVGRFMGSEALGANNGFVASGYAHAGLLGVLFYALLIGFILKFVNDITYNLLPLWFSVSLTVVPLRNLLISSDLFTVMLTHGFIVALIIILLARSKKYVSFE